MFELIEIELTRVRRMAEQADNELLLYLIDMTIVEANREKLSGIDSPKATKKDLSVFA
jgi:hypothetical protein